MALAHAGLELPSTRLPSAGHSGRGHSRSFPGSLGGLILAGVGVRLGVDERRDQKKGRARRGVKGRFNVHVGPESPTRRWARAEES